MHKYIKIPHEITDKSFEIIDKEIFELKPDYKFNSEIEEYVIKRVIHTTADFEYLDTLKFTGDAATKIQNVIKSGNGHIITDTNMGLSGINKKILDEFGCQYHCFIRDSRVFKLAKEKGITRSMAAIELASQLKGPKVFVVGNAPTAIFRILEMISDDNLDVEAVVGIPVGFVGAIESKQDLHDSPIPSIVSLSRKGGSNVAASIINAIQYNIKQIIHQN